MTPARLPPIRGEIRFEQVDFGYDETQPVLQNLNFQIRPGRHVAIFGATGAGKSTLLELIPRFHDVTQGQVLVDGADVRVFDLETLRKSIGQVFQENLLFRCTIAENIAFGHPEASGDQIEKAARTAGAHEFIRDLPRGYDTLVEEGAVNLSGGQRQRIAIARALLQEPPILLLDDPTAAVDAETEHEILEAVWEAMRGRTAIIVANRLSTLRRADEILVLLEGRVVQRGTHEQLIAEPGVYLQAASLQAADVAGSDQPAAAPSGQMRPATIPPLPPPPPGATTQPPPPPPAATTQPPPPPPGATTQPPPPPPGATTHRPPGGGPGDGIGGPP